MVVAGIAAGAFFFARKKPGTAARGLPAPPGSTAEAKIKQSSLAAYIQQLYDLAETKLPAYKKFWHRDRLRALILDAAKKTGVNPEHIWGIMYGESRLVPTGVNGQSSGSAAIAIGKKSTAYGMAQILSTRFEKSEKPAAKAIWWKHHDLLTPRASVWTVAHSLARQMRKIGREPTPYEVGYWWAQGDTGAKRKEKQIKAHGAEVYAAEGTGPIAPMVVGPPLPIGVS